MICSSLSMISGVFCLRKKRARKSSLSRRRSTMRVNLRQCRSSATTPFPMLSSELATLSTSSMIWKAMPTLFMHSINCPTASPYIPITAPIIFTSIRNSPPVFNEVNFMQSSVEGSSALLLDLWLLMSRPCPMWQRVISLRYISLMRHLSSGVGREAINFWTGRKYIRLAALMAESTPKTVCAHGFPRRWTESSSMSSMMRLAQCRCSISPPTLIASCLNLWSNSSWINRAAMTRTCFPPNFHRQVQGCRIYVSSMAKSYSMRCLFCRYTAYLLFKTCSMVISWAALY